MKFIKYFRVSTQKQGKSGNGLDAQQRDINLYLDVYAEQAYDVIGEFQDIQSGKDDNRPELTKAIALAKKTGATLLVSKLDRLSRKVSFIATVMDDKKLNLVVASMPNADKFQLHIYAALAEQERDFISLRTKAGLKSVKERNKKLIAEGVSLDAVGEDGKTLIRKIGGNNTQALAKATQIRINDADAFAKKLESVIKPHIGKPLRQIADILNEAGVTTIRGSQFDAKAVSRIIKRLEV